MKQSRKQRSIYLVNKVEYNITRRKVSTVKGGVTGLLVYTSNSVLSLPVSTPANYFWRNVKIFDFRLIGEFRAALFLRNVFE